MRCTLSLLLHVRMAVVEISIYLEVLYDVSYSYALSFVIACTDMSYAIMTIFFRFEIVSSVMIEKFKET